MGISGIGRPIDTTALIDHFSAPEGSINLYFGRIGNGKTYSATADILDLLHQGRVVYANWRINYEGFDERESFIHWFYKTLFFQRTFYKFAPQNLRYFSDADPSTWVINRKRYNDIIQFLGDLTDCDIFIDEGQWLLNSYEGTKFSDDKKRFILHTRHVNRSLNIVSQRTQAIHVTARGQIHRFFKCEKKMQWPFLIFKRTEFQDMVENDVDEDAEPISTKTYFANKNVLNAYNSKYLRGGIEKSQEVHFSAYKLNVFNKIHLFFSLVRSRVFRRGAHNSQQR